MNEQETKTIINHIAAELHNPVHSRMSVFVGAGFSKNADPRMPTWSDLGKLFKNKLGVVDDKQELFAQKITEMANQITQSHDHDTLNQIIKICSNQSELPAQTIMDMADQITQLYGRATLNQIIEASIVESQYSYNILHKRLAEQPWRDIFTTNYDRYIENAAVTVPGIAYQTITTPNQLVGSSSPRIVKLHGCISTHQYIISSEDYRTYPDKFAPFVNTVRQALIETSCCLIGFSGTDPNFLTWIGWVRDVLGQNQASKIFLISMKNDYSPAQKQLFAQQNIIVVDISVLTKETTHASALNAFFDEISTYKSNNSLKVPIIEEKDIPKMTQDFTNKVQALRASYPGWLYMPSDYRSCIQMRTLNHIIDVIHNNPTENFQQILPDLAWVLNICLMPISDKLKDLFQKYIDTNKQRERVDFVPLKPIFQLLLQHYRHTNQSDQWNALHNFAKDFARKELDAEAQNLLYTENILQQLYQLNLSDIFTLLEDWPKVTTPYWQSRRAMLYAHFGDFTNASAILNQELEKLRIEINTFQYAKQKHAMDLFTYESIILFCLVRVEMHPLNGKTNRTIYKDRSKSDDLYSNRSLYLRQYRIDIENEINLFDIRITNNEYKNTTPWIRRTTNTLFDDDVGVTAYEYLTFLERVGITFPVLHTSMMNESVYQSLLHHLNRYFPYAATIYSLHNNNSNSKIHVEMKPTFLHNLSNIAVDTLCQNALQSCNSYTQKTSISRPPATYPAMLAILATKARPNIRKEIFNFVKNTLATDKFKLFCDLDILIRSLVSSISPTELHEHAIDFVNWGFQASTHNSQLDHKYWHPFMYLNANKMFFHDIPVVDIDENILHDIISYSQLRDYPKSSWYSHVIFVILKHTIFSQSSKEYLIKQLPRDPSSTLPALSILGSNLIPLAEKWGDTPVNAATSYLEAILNDKITMFNGNAENIAVELVYILWQLKRQHVIEYDLYNKTCNKLFKQHQMNQMQNKVNINNPFMHMFQNDSTFYKSLYYTTLFIFIPVLENLSSETQQQINQIIEYFTESDPQKGTILTITHKITPESTTMPNEIFEVLYQLQTNTTQTVNSAIDLFRALLIFKLSAPEITHHILIAISTWLNTTNISSIVYWIKSIDELMSVVSYNADPSSNIHTKLLPDLYEIVTKTIHKSYNLMFNEHGPINHSISDEIEFLYTCSLFARKSYDIYKHTHPDIRNTINLWYERTLGENTINVERLIWQDFD